MGTPLSQQGRHLDILSDICHPRGSEGRPTRRLGGLRPTRKAEGRKEARRERRQNILLEY